MKKISILLVVLMSALLLTSPLFAANAEVQSSGEASQTQTVEELSDASSTTINNLTSKDEEIKKYSEDLGSTTNGTVYYWLMIIQKYSVPVCFIGLTIASLNFFIIGNKKLDKREQGFGMLIAFGLGLIVFQVLPLLFAIIVAGR